MCVCVCVCFRKFGVVFSFYNIFIVEILENKDKWEKEKENRYNPVIQHTFSYLLLNLFV